MNRLLNVKPVRLSNHTLTAIFECNNNLLVCLINEIVKQKKGTIIMIMF